MSFSTIIKCWTVEKEIKIVYDWFLMVYDNKFVYAPVFVGMVGKVASDNDWNLAMF